MEIIWSNELFNRIDQIIDGDKIILNFLNNRKRQLGKTNKFQLFRNYLHTRTLVGLFKNIIKIYTHTYIKISWIFFFFFFFLPSENENCCFQHCCKTLIDDATESAK